MLALGSSNPDIPEMVKASKFGVCILVCWLHQITLLRWYWCSIYLFLIGSAVKLIGKVLVR